MISSTATSEPMKEDVNAAVSASAALPCCAIGYPSNVVATDQASPGMLNRIEVIAPPNSAPQ
ncbi:carbamoylphosphate synthase large subunit [Bradyrhizobium sp. LM6.10]